MRRIIWLIAIVVVVLLVGSLVDRPNFDLTPANPAAGFDAQLHPPQAVSDALHKSCYNCHSTQGEIPWYAHVWPASVLVQNDIRQGRTYMDLSNWSNLSPEMSRIRLIDSCRMMKEAKMPPAIYRPLHPGAAQSAQEAQAMGGLPY